jgi:DNA-binding NarL/FixJ family response regulator
MNVVLLGANGTLRDLVAALLSIQNINVAVASTEGFEPSPADAENPPVLVLVEPGRPEWQVAGRHPGRVVLVSGRELGDDEAVKAVLEGADAVLHADLSPRDLAASVAAVCQGDTVLSPSQLRRLVKTARERRAPAQSLTPREIEILASVERGESVKQTARALGITPKTVENLQGRLFRKLGARNRAHAVILAHRSGLLPSVAARA